MPSKDSKATPGASAPAKSAAEGLHDPIRQSRLIRDALESARGRVGFFLGAGCPLGVYDEEGGKSLKLIPDVAKLTEDLRHSLSAADDNLADQEKFSPVWDALVIACKEGAVAAPNVEHILTELRTITSRRGKDPFGTINKDRLQQLDARVCDLIVEAVGKSLPKHRCAYHRLASWVGGVTRAAPIDIFTPNYDLLIEEAFEHHRIPHFDGFVGSKEPFFDIASIEHDFVPKRWTRLWKIHGSVNWQRREDGGVFRSQGPAARGKAMIYPSHLKYDQSRRMPYLAMIDRFRSFFRFTDARNGLGAPVLIVCGYSFSDDHLNEVLLDGLRGNPSAHCFTLAYGSLADSKAAVQRAQEQPNLTVVAWDGAVIGTKMSGYTTVPDDVSAREPWISVEKDESSTHVTRCRLGDFHYFCLLLERLYGGSPSPATPVHGT